MREKKKHLDCCGFNITMCGIPIHPTLPVCAKTYAEVSCRRCMRSETYTRYLEGCASGYYRTGKLVTWLQRIVDEFDFEKALKLADDWNRKLSGVNDDPFYIRPDVILKFISNTWALLAINKGAVPVVKEEDDNMEECVGCNKPTCYKCVKAKEE